MEMRRTTKNVLSQKRLWKEGLVNICSLIPYSYYIYGQQMHIYSILSQYNKCMDDTKIFYN